MCSLYVLAAAAPPCVLLSNNKCHTCFSFLFYFLTNSLQISLCIAPDCCRSWRAVRPAARRRRRAASSLRATAATTWTTWTWPGCSWPTMSSGRWVSAKQKKNKSPLILSKYFNKLESKECRRRRRRRRNTWKKKVCFKLSAPKKNRQIFLCEENSAETSFALFFSISEAN